jgi:hypothetical protein
MRTIYMADDGKQFDDKYDCLDYEFGMRIKGGAKQITIIDENGAVVHTPLTSEDTYSNAYKIIVTGMLGIRTLQEISDYAGFTAYDDIDVPGVWVYNKDDLNPHFKKED